jgi:hypothetical protein
MHWPKFFIRAAQVLAAVGVVGLLLAILQGGCSVYYMAIVPDPTLPADQPPTEEELRAHREESWATKRRPYARAKDRTGHFVLIGFGALITAFAIGLPTERALARREGDPSAVPPLETKA